jgi:hypothetical protein
MQQGLIETPHPGTGGVRNFSLMLGCWERLCTYNKEYPNIHEGIAYCLPQEDTGGMCHWSEQRKLFTSNSGTSWNNSAWNNAFHRRPKWNSVHSHGKVLTGAPGEFGHLSRSQPNAHGEAEAWPPLWVDFQMIYWIFPAAEWPARSFTVSHYREVIGWMAYRSRVSSQHSCTFSGEVFPLFLR